MDDELGLLQNFVMICSLDGKIIEADDFVREHLGYGKDELRGKAIVEILDKSSGAEMMECINHIQSSNRKSISAYFLVSDGNCMPAQIELRTLSVQDQIFIFLSIRFLQADKINRSIISADIPFDEKLFGFISEGYAYCKMEYEGDEPVDWIYLKVNKAFEELTGLKNASGRRVTEIIPGIKESDPELFEIYSRVAKSGRHEKFETYLKALQMWFSVSVYCPLYGHFIAVFEVITQRKLMEEKLLQNEMWLRQLIEQAGDGFELLDENGKIVDVNSTTCSQLGYSKEELLELDIYTIDPFLDKSVFDARFSSVYSGGPITIETEHRRKDGTLFPVEIRLSSIYSSEKKQISALVRDISERRLTEEKQRRLSERLMLALEASNAGTWDWDIVNHTFFWSEEFYHIFQIDQSSKPGFDAWESRLHPDDIESAKKKIADAIEKKKQLRNDYRIILPNGEIKWIRAIGNTLYKNDVAVRMVGLCLDITERKLDQKEIDLKNELLRVTGQLAKIGGWEFETDTMKGTWTDEVANIHDLDPSVPTDVKLGVSFYLPESRSKIEQAIQNTIKNAVSYDLELDMISAKGIHKWVRTYGIPIVENGRVVKLRGIFQDITEHKQIEDTLQFLTQKHYGTGKYEILKALVIFLAFSYRKACVLIAKLNGTPDEIETIAATVDGELIPNFCQKLAHVPCGKLIEGDTYFVECGLKEQYPNSAILQNIQAESYLGITLYSASSEPIGVIAIIDRKPMTEHERLEKILNLVSITAAREIEREQREELIRASEERFKAVTEYSHNAICILNEQGKIIWANEALHRLGLYTKEQIFSAGSFIDFIAPESAEFVVSNFMRFVSHQEYIHHYEFVIIRADGQKRLCEKYMTDFEELNGCRSLAISMLDITDKRRAEEELVLAKEKAIEMNKIRSSFFNNMSHELRTPLIGILGFSELLEKQLSSDQDASGMAKTIRLSGYRLLETLNNILTVSKLEAEKVAPKLVASDFIQIAAEIVSLFEPTAKTKGLQITFRASVQKLISRTDPVMLRSILNNLINNAVKYTDNGIVWVSIDVKDGKIIICVGDSGIGIAKEKIEVIWEEFRQESEGLNRSFQGTGLGLTITRKYTLLLGGQIDVVSEVGKGSVFSIYFPYSTETTTVEFARDADELISQQDGTAPKESKKLLLYVEDDSVARDFVRRVLSDSYELEYAINAEEAMAAVKRKNYDLILMDINLGHGTNGLQLTAKIREMEFYKKIPFIAVTAFAMYEDRREFLANGLDLYISKPFRVNELRKIVQEGLNMKLSG